MDLSIVTTLYQSETFVGEFYERMIPIAESCFPSFELIFVNDGSPDSSATAVMELAQADSRVVLVDLSRNFGHHHAIMAGLQESKGRLVFLIDIDLEEPPELLADFLRELNTDNVDSVHGVQASRSGSRFKRASGFLFYKLFNLISDTNIPPNLCTVRLMTRRYVDALTMLPDKNLFLAGNLAWIGYDQKPIPIRKQQRSTPSSYSLRQQIALFVNAVTSFTSYPLRLIFYIGLSISVITGMGGTYLIVRKLLNPELLLAGWVSVMISVWFLGGLSISFLGIIGIYLSKIFTEAKGRPSYIVRHVHRTPDGAV